MILVELYSKDDCHLCDEAKVVLEKVQKEILFTLREYKLTPGDTNWEEYKELFPVVHVEKKLAFKYRVNEQMLKIRLHQVQDEIARHKSEVGEEADEGELLA